MRCPACTVPSRAAPSTLFPISAALDWIRAAAITTAGTGGGGNPSGTSFGAFGEGYLRLSYAASLSMLSEAVRRIGAFLEQVARVPLRGCFGGRNMNIGCGNHLLSGKP